MQIEGAVIREQGVTFAVVVVKRHVTASSSAASRAIAWLSDAFDGIPVVLMSQGGFGRAEYRGRPDLARFMASVPMHRVPWRKYKLS